MYYNFWHPLLNRSAKKIELLNQKLIMCGIIFKRQLNVGSYGWLLFLIIMVL